MVPWSLTVRVIGLPNTMIPYQTNLNVLNVRTQLKQLTFLGLTMRVFMKESLLHDAPFVRKYLTILTT